MRETHIDWLPSYTLCLMNFRARLNLRGRLLVGGKATHLLDHVPRELGVLGEAPAVVAEPQSAPVLGHLCPLLRPWGIRAEPWLLLLSGRRAVLCPFLNWVCLFLVVWIMRVFK